MKNMIKLPAIVLGLMLLLTGTTQKVMAQGEDVSLQSFYDELSPYGTWIQDPQYGYVWRPDVEQGDFRPYYTNGRWVMTEYGNTWVSDYDWGWGPFHYGRWVYNRYNEWIWIPDTTWGPAWVSWRSGGGYYGWAPLGPGMHVNINFNIPDLWWVFVPQRNIYYDRFPRYYSRRNVVIINNTTIINNTYVHNRRTYYTGPRADDIRRATRQDVRVYNVNNTGRPSRSSIDGNSVNIYTPRPGRGSSNASAAPREAIRAEGRTTMRDSRTSNGSISARPSRIESRGADNRTGVAPSTRENRPDNGNNSRPSRIQNQESSGARQPQRTERAAPGERQMQRPQQMQTAPEQRTERQERPERAQRQERAERPMQRAEAQRAQPQPRPEQPQRQESRPAQPQMQRPERVQQSPQPSSRGSEGRGGSDGSRPGRGGGRG